LLKGSASGAAAGLLCTAFVAAIRVRAGLGLGGEMYIGAASALYAYDNLNRLITFHRGDLDGDKDEIPVASRTQGETWTLDSVGNWSDYQYDDEGDGSYGGSSDLDQDRTHNEGGTLQG